MGRCFGSGPYATIDCIGVSLFLPLDRRVSDIEAIAQLGFDISQLALLLYLNGSIANQFAMLFLAPVVTSATTLSKRVMFTIAGLGSGPIDLCF